MDTNEATRNLYFDESDEIEEIPETSKKHLAFCSDGIRFAIAYDFVIEIINELSITTLPKVPDYIEGIINLRGQVIPIMDVRLRMNHMKGEMDNKVCIIVIQVEDTVIGLMVDEVLQMIDVDEQRVMPPPLSQRQEYVNGIIRLNNVIYFILDCESLIAV